MDTEAGKVSLPPLTANRWVQIDVPYEQLGIGDKENVKSFTLRAADRMALPAYLIEDIVVKGR